MRSAWPRGADRILLRDLRDALRERLFDDPTEAVERGDGCGASPTRNDFFKRC
jgi:hypothetical protein